MLAPLLLAAAPLFPQSTFEDFDAAGSGMSASYFDTLYINGDGLFRRVPLTAGESAPDTFPPLPVNVGGDKEMRYGEQMLAPSASIALGPESFGDARIEGYLGFGDASTLWPTSYNGGFILRGNLANYPLVSGYFCTMYTAGGDEMFLAVGYVCQGLIHASYANVRSDNFPVDVDNENYHLSFTAQGTRLTASVMRVHVVAGAVVETPIDLSDDPGLQEELVFVDERFAAGYPALRLWARGGNFSLMDDVTVTDLGAGPGTPFCFGDGSTVPCPCGNASSSSEGCVNSHGHGARLHAVGSTSVAADNLILTAYQLRGETFGLFFAGENVTQLPFGDGLRCVDIPFVRFPVGYTERCAFLSASNVASYLGVLPGDTRYFQAWYRDNGGPCGSGFSTSSALAITFTP